jgi:hypothetical protein
MSPAQRWSVLSMALVAGCHRHQTDKPGLEAGSEDAVAQTSPAEAKDAKKACSPDGWCEVMKVKKGSLLAIWGLRSHDIYALWSGVLVHELDLEWTAVPFPARGLLALSGTGPSDVWVAGEKGAIWHKTADWTLMPSGTKKDLRGVAAHAADDVWAVGMGGTLLHFGGTEWKTVFSGTATDLMGVWADATTGEAWAVGLNGTALHWLKGAWTAVPTPTKQALGAIWGSATNDVWAVGGEGTILHWDGKTWSASAPPAARNLYAIWGMGASNVWAVGAAGTILHWDGTTWSVSPSASSFDLHGVWGADERDVWVVGFSSSTGETATLRRHR